MATPIEKKEDIPKAEPSNAAVVVIDEERDDAPSFHGHFGWVLVGKEYIPWIKKADETKYSSVRIAEMKLLGPYLAYLNSDILSCCEVKSFALSECEAKLFTEINSKHCDNDFGLEPFTVTNDHIVKVDDLLEFYSFLETCYNKLLLRVTGKDDRCGFIRINSDSVVPYTIKNNLKYVPLFYFEGETDSLKLKCEHFESWDLAYLKFCCKVQGIKNDLFKGDSCLVTSLEDIRSYFPDNTCFEDYWPQKNSELQVLRKDNNAGYQSWIRAPPNGVIIPTASRSTSVSLPPAPIPIQNRALLVNNRAVAPVPARQIAPAVNGGPNMTVYQYNWQQSTNNVVPNNQMISQQPRQPQHRLSTPTNIQGPPQRNIMVQQIRPQNSQYYNSAVQNTMMSQASNLPTSTLVRATTVPSLPTNPKLSPTAEAVRNSKSGTWEKPLEEIFFVELPNFTLKTETEWKQEWQQHDKFDDEIVSKPVQNSSAQRQREYRQRIKEYRERIKLEKILSGELVVPKPVPKTPAERQREYRERKKLEQTLTGELVPKRVPKTAAEYQRKYRQRKKLKKALSGELVPKPVRKTSAERQKKYRQQKSERKKEYREQIKLEKILFGEPVVPNPVPKTPAERQREYRQRKKLKKTLSGEFVPKPVPKTAAERQRECRQQKTLKKALSKELVPLKSVSKTPAERIREHQQWKKLEKTVPSKIDRSNRPKKAKTNAEICKQYRERKKLGIQLQPKKAKTNAEICKRYRERKKLEQIVFADPAPRTPAEQQREHEEQKEYEKTVSGE